MRFFKDSTTSDTPRPTQQLYTSIKIPFTRSINSIFTFINSTFRALVIKTSTPLLPAPKRPRGRLKKRVKITPVSLGLAELKRVLKKRILLARAVRVLKINTCYEDRKS